jgi:hypothetical protein
MPNFYRVSIDDIALSSTGTESGVPCFLEVTNVEDLLTEVTGTVIEAINAAPVIQMMPWTSGKQFDVRVEILNTPQWTAIKNLITAAQAAAFPNDRFTVAGTGDIGDFTVTVKPFPVKPFAAASFGHGRINNAVFRFITV